MSTARFKTRVSAFPSTDSLAIGKAVVEAQAQGLEALYTQLDSTFEEVVACLLGTRGKVIVSGVGKSGHIARKIASTLSSTGTPACFLHPTEANHGDLGFLDASDALLVFSNSGETHELMHLMPLAKQMGIPVILVTASPGSRLAALAQLVLILPKVPEACPMGLAPMTSTTLMLVLGDALAAGLIHLRGFTPDQYRDRHPGGALGSKLRPVVQIMRPIGSVACLSPDASVQEALLAMARSGISFVLVGQHPAFSQVLSAKSIPDQGLAVPLNQLPLASLSAVSSQASVEAAYTLIKQERADVLRVVDADQTCIGFVAAQDCV